MESPPNKNQEQIPQKPLEHVLGFVAGKGYFVEGAWYQGMSITKDTYQSSVDYALKELERQKLEGVDRHGNPLN